ncbi:MAG: hypothetical protein IKU24_03755 [Clostridia bacterium]|nr:hypothetical protein [Clostridia bacterium]
MSCPIVGNKALLEAIFTAIRHKHIAGCYIIEGAFGTGKLTIARYIASAICCTAPNEDATPCLSCHSCKNISIGNHVDTIEIAPEEEGKNITVSQIREMLRSAHNSTTEGDWRIFIIRDSQNMKKEAQNALLKSIEEPGKNTVFFLLTTDKTKLLPTVRSRAVYLHTDPLTDKEIRPLLLKNGVLEKDLEEVILLSSGSLGKAISLSKDTALLEMRERVLSYFSAIMNGAGFTKLCLIFPPSTMTRKDLFSFLTLTKSALRDLICKRSKPDSKREFFSSDQFVLDLSSIISPTEAVKLFDHCEKLLASSEQNVNLFSALSGFHLMAQNLTKN